MREKHKLGDAVSVLHVDTERGWGGGQQQVLYLERYLVEKGINSVIICQPKSNLHRWSEKEELPHIPLVMRGEFDILAGFRIARIARREGIAILHLHTAHAIALGLWAKLFFSPLRLIAVRRVSLPIKKNILSLIKYKNRYLDRIVCISDMIRNELMKDGVSEGKLVVIKSGVDLTRFENLSPPPELKKKLNIPEDHVIVGTVASLVKLKDYPNLVRAARIVIDRLQSVTFVAVGDGPEREEVTKLARSLGLGGRFVFVGFRDDVGNFLKIFDIFALASAHEGLGTSLIDAQSVGLPIVATNVGGIPEIVSDGKNGFLVEPRDPDALAAAIARLASDPNLRRQFGGAARKSSHRFDITHAAAENLALYRGLIKNGEHVKKET